MDSPRDRTRMELENPRLSPSPELEELFHQVFDWQAYSGDAKPSDPSSSHHHHRQQSLSRIITDIPSFIRDLTLDSERDFFDMPSYSSDDGLTSDYSAGQTPPELVQGGSSSPSDHSGASPFLEPLDDGHYHPEASLREVQAQDDEWTYPQTDPSKGMVQGYPHHLQVQLDERLRRAAEQSSKLKRRRSGNDLEKRQRQLVDPGQTADVRKSGACLPCRVSKTRCHDSGVCPTCRKAFPDHSHLACTRATPSTFWPVMGKIPDVWSTNPKEEEQLCSGPRFYTGKPREISVFFTPDTSLPALRATVQAYRSQGGSEETGSLTKADFPRDCVPSHQLLQRWVESQIRTEQKSDFHHSVQNFVLSYSEEGWGLPKYDLVNKVHRMNCFFRIWKARSFWCLDPTNKLTTLPLSVQAQLRNIARRAIYSLEHDILKEMDECIAQQGPPKAQERIAIWASMWQLILMYRELMQGFKTHIGRLATSKSESTQNIAFQGQLYKRLADSFFPLLVVFYHYQFRTKKSLELSLDWLKAPTYPPALCHNRAIRESAQQLLDCRKDHYQKLQSSKSEIDQLLCVFVVNHELKKMNARKRPSKAKSSKHAIEDDCDDDAE
ncbi:hypothetical protein HDV57DRAFT_392431 [Trichoderma longibrachiatum]|uniref:Uncharacterized protein n=1 Tax=Trichoderma longibrachiatum ATCC 18648 TaxID=983965 RepID=A0A2T4C3M2_TRILO|nr:hypothetical protein M440DRAFT_1462943 [Trichoderma longibrachiatum ATCC 18648]